MQGYDETLRDLTEKMKEKESVARKLQAARTQHSVFAQKVATLYEQYKREEKDVTNLEGHGVAALFYAALGKKQEKLDKERAEAFAAKAKYDAAQYELTVLAADIDFFTAKMEKLAAYEAEYQSCFAQKANAIKASGSVAGETILRLEQTISEYKHQQKELNEALAAGDAALTMVQEIQDHLKSAQDWGTWDVLGGGIISDMAKHDHLNKAQTLVQNLQSQLRRFQTELADVKITGDLQVSVDGFLGFADYFFDGLFVDWMVLDKIKNATTQVRQTKQKIEQVHCQLHYLREAADEEVTQAEQERQTLVVATRL